MTSSPQAVLNTDQFEGWLDHVSLVLNIACSRQQLDAALGSQAIDEPLSNLCRTYVHELTHVNQALGTTIGYYTWMLRAVQADNVVRMLQWLVEMQLPLYRRLITYLPSTEMFDDRAAGHIHGWQIAESLISELAGSPKGYLSSGNKFPIEATTWEELLQKTSEHASLNSMKNRTVSGQMSFHEALA